ncbi:hypothetical protein ARMSODRAFT_1027861 [Armillaria solidipes]|uniref:Uncharacterized protein n=1 Tax=Armillaria solidipes TaxID=1076256 RepID=A0A2H3AJ39_9AGAR|nr:hypothetical protein ARMSODRAFT_1027861 [Armillaria solidipes]
MHSNIPLPAFNISSTTSKPVLESKNQYDVLMDNDKMDPHSSASNDEAKDETESLLTVPNNGTNHLTSGTGQQSESSPPEKAAPRAETTAGQMNPDNAPRVIPSRAQDSGKGEQKTVPPSSEETGRINQSEGTTRIQPAAPSGSGSSAVSDLLPGTPPETPGEDARKAVGANQRTGDAPTRCQVMEAERKEAASTQAVKRGHAVTMVKVPDKEDDMVYQVWLAKQKEGPRTTSTQTMNSPSY